MVFICENKLLCSCSRSQGFTLLHLPLHLSHCFSFCTLFIFFPRVAIQDISLTNSAPIALVHIRLVCFWDKEKERWILSHGSQDSNWGLDGSMPITRQKSSSWVWEMKKRTVLVCFPLCALEDLRSSVIARFFIQWLFWLELLTPVVCQTLAAMWTQWGKNHCGVDCVCQTWLWP